MATNWCRRSRIQAWNISIAAGKFILHWLWLIRRPCVWNVRRWTPWRFWSAQLAIWNWWGNHLRSGKKSCSFMRYWSFSCRIFLCEIEWRLGKMAIESGETNEEEFIHYLQFFSRAQEFIQKIRGCYQDDEHFQELLAKLISWIHSPDFIFFKKTKTDFSRRN